MKTRFVSALALAAAVTLGATGCSLIADQATLYEYAPSDGINANAGDIEVRNALLIASAEEGTYNLSFTAVNPGEAPAELNITVSEDGKNTTHSVTVEPGTTLFGDAKKDQELVILHGLDTKPGAGVEAFFQSGSSEESGSFLPALDGTLPEYTPFVLSASDLAKQAEDADAEATAPTTGDAN